MHIRQAQVTETRSMGGSYELTRAQVAQALDSLIRAKQLKIESAEQVIRVLRVFKIGKSDFADCLIEH